MQAIRNAVVYPSVSEMQHLDSLLLAGEQVQCTRNTKGAVWDAALCKDDPQYLSLMKEHGVYNAMFCASPGA
jgi:hypothetical protein